VLHKTIKRSAKTYRYYHRCLTKQ